MSSAECAAPRWSAKAWQVDFHPLLRYSSLRQAHHRRAQEFIHVGLTFSRVQALIHCAGYLARPFSGEIVGTNYFSLQDPN